MNTFYTSIKSTDGLGAQYQKIIETYIFCKFNNLSFVYSPLTKVDHNYNNNIFFLDNLEKLINLKENILNLQPNMIIKEVDYNNIVIPFFENNIDICIESEHMKYIKNCFWKNKNKNLFNNDIINIAVHIRRPNICDDRVEGANTPDTYYLNIIDRIRTTYQETKKLFHIYSQGNETDFNCFQNKDVQFHINEDIELTFLGLVSAQILVTSASSLSYSAAMISDGEIIFLPFWHKPYSKWHIINENAH